MPGKTKYLSVVFVSVVMGLAGIVLYRSNPKREMSVATEKNPSPSSISSSPIHSAEKKKSGMTTLSPGDVVDPQDWVENGPKEPLIPPEIHVEAQIPPGSSITLEPLVPPEIRVEPIVPPGSSISNEPLKPPEIQAGSPTP